MEKTKVVNRSLETYLRCYVSDHPRQLYKFLHLAEFWYNISFHSATNMTPFKALYRRDPPNIIDYITDSSHLDPLGISMQQHIDILVKLKKNLPKSRRIMEKQANQKRMTYTFQPDNLVPLKLQPYRQNTMKKRTSEKLAKRFFGPFKIIKYVGEVAYLLDLPSSSHIHPVVHVSLLRPYFGTEPKTDFRLLPFNKLIDFMRPDLEVPLNTDSPHTPSSLQGSKKETNINQEIQTSVLNINKVASALTSILVSEKTLQNFQEEVLGTRLKNCERNEEVPKLLEKEETNEINCLVV